MPDTSTQPPNDATGDRTSFVADVRARLMEDLAPVEIIAEALGKSPRTIQRMIARGKLATVTIGRTPYVVVSRARELVLAAPTVRRAFVRRGRPAGRKAA